MPATPPKIADGLPNANEILGDRFATATTDDGKLWFVSRKGVNQPSISYFHETPLQGGNLVFFDTHTKSWSKPTPFSPISDEELLEGVVFGYKNRLLLLTYQRSGKFAFRALYEWRNYDWRKSNHFVIDKTTEFDCGDRTDVRRVTDASGNVYFIAERGFGLNLYKFELSGDGNAAIALQRDINFAYPQNACSPHTVRATISGHHLYAIYGQQGCGFRWEPTRPLRIDLRDGSVEHIQIGNDPDDRRGSCPPWAFSGAYADRFVPPSQWFFLGGCRARGLSSTEDDSSIWVLDLEKKEWKRFEKYDLPEGARFAGAFGGDKEKFYFVNVNNGVYEFDQ